MSFLSTPSTPAPAQNLDLPLAQNQAQDQDQNHPPRWLQQRAEWARPTSDRHAHRRARARAAWNRKRQEAAERRRRELLALWHELGPVPMKVLFAHYQQRIWAAASPATFWRDVRALRERNFASVRQEPSQRLPARERAHGGVWMARCLALKLAVRLVLRDRPELVQAVEQLAARYTRALSAVPGAADSFTGPSPSTGPTTAGATTFTAPRPRPQP